MVHLSTLSSTEVLGFNFSPSASHVKAVKRNSAPGLYFLYLERQ